MEEIILIGGGGHCRVIIDTILLRKEYKIAGIIDVKEKIGQEIAGIPIIDSDESIERYFKKGIKNCFVSMGSTGSTALRKKLFDTAENARFFFPNIIHPVSLVSASARLGYGNYVAPGAIINTGACIGNNCIINSGAIIEHDCHIEDFTHVASGVTLGGMVNIGKYSHIGAGSSILQGIKIGENSIVGAGSVVVDDIKDSVVACGAPCRKIKDNV